jgi:hypothetical protein
MRTKEIEQVKRAIRQPYACPGGYPVYVVMADGELLCADCAKAEFRQIIRDTRWKSGCWAATGAEILWEAPEDVMPNCCHCHKPLNPTYGA